jgi:hypothetical protein
MWGHSSGHTCLVPLLLPLPTFLGPYDSVLQNELHFFDGIKVKLTQNLKDHPWHVGNT